MKYLLPAKNQNFKLSKFKLFFQKALDQSCAGAALSTKPLFALILETMLAAILINRRERQPVNFPRRLLFSYSDSDSGYCNQTCQCLTQMERNNRCNLVPAPAWTLINLSEKKVKTVLKVYNLLPLLLSSWAAVPPHVLWLVATSCPVIGGPAHFHDSGKPEMHGWTVDLGEGWNS